MRLEFYRNNKKKLLNIGKINIFYGYSNSGKTTFAEDLEEGLLGKDKSFTINNLSILKEENNVILINSKESIIDHIKLSSKSYLKKLYISRLQSYFDEHNEIVENINNNFIDANSFLEKLCYDFNQKTSLGKIHMSIGIDNESDIINNLMKVEFETETISSSASKELLFMLVSLIEQDGQNTHIIIDDFDAFLDEETTIRLFSELEKINGTVYLFTNKPNSMMFALGRYPIFNIREEKILDFSNILFLLKKSLEDLIPIENQTYEEYMLNYGYFENSGELAKIESTIKNNSIYNLGRMLTSKNFTITNAIDYSKISIIPANEYEERFLKYIESLINND